MNMTDRPTPRRVLLLTVLAATSLLAACGASGGSEGASTTTAANGGDGVTTTTGEDGPSTTDVETSTTTEPDQDDSGRQAYVDALAEGFADDDTAPFDEDQVDCLGNGFVDAIGYDELKRAGVTPEEFGEGDDFGGKLTIDEAIANDLYDQYEACGIDLKAFLKEFATDFTDGGKLSAAQEACVDKALTEENLRRSLVADLMGEDIEDDPLDAVDDCVDFSVDIPNDN